jgi:LPXTG-motif cell wall-anchored protein
VKLNYANAARYPAIAFAAAGAAVAGIGLFLWRRRNPEREAPVESSTEAEVEAHPS